MAVLQFRKTRGNTAQAKPNFGGPWSGALLFALAFIGAVFVYAGVGMLSSDALSGSIMAAVGVILLLKPLMYVFAALRPFTGASSDPRGGEKRGGRGQRGPRGGQGNGMKTYH